MVTQTQQVTERVDSPVGKRVGSHLYIHKGSIHHLPEDDRILLAKALMVAGEFAFDLIKIAFDASHICLLSYPNFDTDPHPALKYSIKVLFPSGQTVVTDYSNSPNPPILHRKETFVSPEHPSYVIFATLSEAEERHGLLNRPDIGHQKQWKALLASKNLTIKGHCLSQKK